MLPQFSRFNSNRKGIVLKCSKFHKSCHLNQHQMKPATLSTRCFFIFIDATSSCTVLGRQMCRDTPTTTMRSWEPGRSRFMNVLLEQFPSPRKNDRQKMYHQKTPKSFLDLSEIDPESWKYHPSTKFQTNDLGQRASSLVTLRFSNWLSGSFFLCFWASWLGDSSSRGWMNRTDGMVGLWRHADTVDCWCTVETLTF